MGIITPENKLKITGRVKELYKLENGKWVAPGIFLGNVKANRLAVGVWGRMNGCGLYACNPLHPLLPVTYNNRLCVQGQSEFFNKVPLELSNYCAAEAVCNPPLGACAVRDLRLEMATRRTSGLVTLANQSLVGAIWPLYRD